MATTYEVQYTDGRKVQAVGSPRAEVEVEKNHSQLHNGPILTWIYRVAWQSLVFDGKESRSFEDFLVDVVDISPLPAKAEDVDPTRLAPQPNGSLPSVPALASASPSSEPAPGE